MRSNIEAYHRPVLLREVLSLLLVQENAWYLDATLGDGGHSLEILKRGGRVLGLDVDPKALERARKRFKEEGIVEDQFKLIQGNFRDLENLIKKPHYVRLRRTSRGRQTAADGQKFKAIIFDLGVSSLQLEDPSRGFSFSQNGPLDMRMDPSLKVTAADLVKVLRKDQLNELFSKLGDEKRSRAMASAVDSARKIADGLQGTGVSTTGQLAKIIESIAGRKRQKIHPATRIFQALRIAVNDELNSLKEALPQALRLLDSSGLILVISFHSLEDRIIKDYFRKWHDQGLGEIVTKKPITPNEKEVRENFRSRSGKLRVFKRIYYP